MGFKSAVADAGFVTGLEPSLHGSPDILSRLVARPPTVATPADSLLSAYKSISSLTNRITPLPTPAAPPAPTGFGASLASPAADSRLPPSPTPALPRESAADAAARYDLQSHYPTFAGIFPNTFRAVYGKRSASPAFASLPIHFLVHAYGQATDAYGALLLCCASAAADAPANGARGRFLAQDLQDPKHADITIADAIRSGDLTWTPSPLDTALCFLPLGHFALYIILQHYIPNDEPVLAALYAITDNISFVRSGPNDLDFESLRPLRRQLAELAHHEVSYDAKRVLKSLIKALRPLNRCSIHLPDGVSIGSYAARQVGLYETAIAAYGGSPPSKDHIDGLLSDLRNIAILHARVDASPPPRSHTAFAASAVTDPLPVPPGTTYTGVNTLSASTASCPAPLSSAADADLVAQFPALAGTLATGAPAALAAAIASAVADALNTPAIASAVADALNARRRRSGGPRLRTPSAALPSPPPPTVLTPSSTFAAPVSGPPSLSTFEPLHAGEARAARGFPQRTAARALAGLGS